MTSMPSAIRAAFAATILSVAVAPALPAPEWIDPGWAADKVWDDGMAEVNTYESTRTIYGKSRPHETVSVVVKEDFDPGLMVKSDRPADSATIPVLKFAWIAERIDTENYPYDFASNVFVDRNDPARVLKAVVTSHEWCGIAFKEIQGWKKPPVMRSYSYWDREGSAEHQLPGGVVPLEALPMILRAFDSQTPAQFPVLGPLMSSHTPAPTTIVVSAENISTDTITVPAGTFECRQVVVAPAAGFGDPIMTLWFETARPNRLIRVLGPGPTESALKSSRRWDYWSRNPAPADAPPVE